MRNNLRRGGAPINTELVSRPWRNLAAIVADRAQNVLSFTQRGDTSAQYTLTGTSSPNGAWVLLGRGVAQVPYAPATIDLTATVIGAAAVSGASRVRIVAAGVSAILDCAALGFLGLGAQPPTPEWGEMLSRSYSYIVSGAWWAATFPGIAILFSVLGLNLLGDGLRDVLDPRLKT